ncbi:MAG TPA: hypothetical protein VEK82_10450 [Stellaceae bacterium]|nr:hypothetical protein [Stellaceae bacterium]
MVGDHCPKFLCKRNQVAEVIFPNVEIAELIFDKSRHGVDNHRLKIVLHYLFHIDALPHADRNTIEIVQNKYCLLGDRLRVIYPRLGAVTTGDPYLTLRLNQDRVSKISLTSSDGLPLSFAIALYLGLARDRTELPVGDTRCRQRGSRLGNGGNLLRGHFKFRPLQ